MQACAGNSPRVTATLPLGGCGVGLCVLFCAVLLFSPVATPLLAHREDRPGVLLLHARRKDAPYATVLRSEITQVLDQELGRRYDLYFDKVK